MVAIRSNEVVGESPAHSSSIADDEQDVFDAVNAPMQASREKVGLKIFLGDKIKWDR